MKKANYRKVLAKLSMRDKNLQKNLQKVVFTGKEWSLLADTTNTLVKTLNSSFKKVLNETLKPNSKQIQEVFHGTAKTFTKDIENKWDERVVETKSATSANFLRLFS